MFELKLKKFLNPTGKDSQGNCCEGYRNTNDHQCSGQCATKFRVCLKHFQNKIDHTRDCTFGEQITSVVGHNSMEIDNQPIEFEIDFKWPVSEIYPPIFRFFRRPSPLCAWSLCKGGDPAL